MNETFITPFRGNPWSYREGRSPEMILLLKMFLSNNFSGDWQSCGFRWCSVANVCFQRMRTRRQCGTSASCGGNEYYNNKHAGKDAEKVFNFLLDHKNRRETGPRCVYVDKWLNNRVVLLKHKFDHFKMLSGWKGTFCLSFHACEPCDCFREQNQLMCLV